MIVKLNAEKDKGKLCSGGETLLIDPEQTSCPRIVSVPEGRNNL
jgi:hypothetical protein